MTWKYNIFLKARLTHNGQFYPSFFLSKSHIAEVPNSGKILLYWLFRSKIWYFRVIWLFTAKYFTKIVFFDAFWRAAVKNQNKTIQSIYSPSWIIFSRLRHCVIGTSYILPQLLGFGLSGIYITIIGITIIGELSFILVILIIESPLYLIPSVSWHISGANNGPVFPPKQNKKLTFFQGVKKLSNAILSTYPDCICVIGRGFSFFWSF